MYLGRDLGRPRGGQGLLRDLDKGVYCASVGSSCRRVEEEAVALGAGLLRAG